MGKQAVVSHKQVIEAASSPSAVWLDVRGEQEIVDSNKYVATEKLWFQADCSSGDCPLLRATAENMIQDKNAVVLVYGRSGQQASAGVEILRGKGYKTVVNVGSISDIPEQLMMNTTKRSNWWPF
jgi:rhodanese-related sulfurtransferase